MQVPSLFVIKGRDQGQLFELEEEVASIGRVGDNTLQLQDTEVSRNHAELRLEGDEYSINDLNSSNGTYVNGKATRRHLLKSGDHIQLGRTLLLYTGAKEEQAAAADSQVDIVARAQDEDGSRILHAMSQSEGSELLSAPPDQTQSPWMLRARSNLQLMYRTALAASHTLDIDQLLSRIMDMIFEWVEADRGCIMLYDDDSGELSPRVQRQRRGLRSDDRITISKTILDYVVENSEGVLTSNARDDDRWNPAASIVQMGVREAICVPMQGRYGIVGVIYIDTSITPQRILQNKSTNQFNQDHLKLMIAIAHQAGLAVEDTSYYKAMVQSERLAAVGQTIASLSHHIKNILQGVRGGSYLIDMGMKQHEKAFAEAITQDSPSGENAEEVGAAHVDIEAALKAVSTMRKGWGIVEKNQDRISGLVMDMLTYSKEREPDPEAASLNEVTADVVEMMQTRAREANVELLWQPDEQLPTLFFDPEAMHRAILNVVGNAIDACEISSSNDGETDAENQATVTISTDIDEDGKFAAVAVQDTGVGIEKEDLEKIFTAFVSKKGGRGTGLGLPVTQKILEEHGGRVRVTSELGQGSCFRLELPATKPAAKNEKALHKETLEQGPMDLAKQASTGDPQLEDSADGSGPTQVPADANR